MNQEQTNITTGKQIRHLRTQLGMTQEELAGELNVTRQALSNWERDVNEPDLNTLKKICFLFGSDGIFLLFLAVLWLLFIVKLARQAERQEIGRAHV